MSYFIARLDEKPTLLGNSEKTLKSFDENSKEKLIFLFLFFIFFENFLLKKAFGNTTNFYNIFFGFGARGNFLPSPPPLATPQSLPLKQQVAWLAANPHYPLMSPIFLYLGNISGAYKEMPSHSALLEQYNVSILTDHNKET